MPNFEDRTQIDYLEECHKNDVSPIGVKYDYDKKMETFLPDFHDPSYTIMVRRDFNRMDGPELVEHLIPLKESMLGGKVHQLFFNVSYLEKEIASEKVKEIVNKIEPKDYVLGEAEITLSKYWAGPHRGDDSRNTILFYRSDSESLHLGNYNSEIKFEKEFLEWINHLQFKE